MDRIRVMADLVSIRQLAKDIEVIDDEFTTISMDAREIQDMASTLIELVEEAEEITLIARRE